MRKNAFVPLVIWVFLIVIAHLLWKDKIDRIEFYALTILLYALGIDNKTDEK